MIDDFFKYTSFKKEDLKKYSKITSGSSNNDNYLIELKNKNKYQLRVPITKKSYESEKNIFKTHFKDRLIFLNNEGVLIKEWIEGTTPDTNDKETRKQILKAIHSFQKLEPPKKTPSFGFDFYNDQYKKFNPELLKEFNETLKELKQEKTSLIHGDINLLNMVKTNSGIELIDFEWVSVGPSIIDYAYLIAFSKFNIKEVSSFTKCSVDKLKRYSRFLLIHTIMWANHICTTKSKKLSDIAMTKLNIKE